MRIIGGQYNLLYTVWCTNEHELYDMNVRPPIPPHFPFPLIAIDANTKQRDPGQLTNLALPSKQHTLVSTQPISKLQSRLDALLLVLKTCKAASCTDPWAVLHPKGDVANLEDALAAKYDGFYATQPKVAFEKCELGQILSSEGPLVGKAYHGGEMWPHWV